MVMWTKSKLLLLLIVSLLSCNRQYEKQFVKEVVVSDLSKLPKLYSSSTRRGGPCGKKENYIPDADHIEHTPVKIIRMNFHVMNNSNGKGNIDEKTGVEFIKQVFKTSNWKLKSNRKMNLPPGNDTPVLPPRYQYKIVGMPDDPNDDGIYFHNDDELYFMIAGGRDQNNFDREVYNKYGVQKDSVLNVFVMADHIDSLKSKTYRSASRGVGFGKWLKVVGFLKNSKKFRNKNGKRENIGKYSSMRLLNHEVGHCVGLRHTWKGNDGCDDTPNHSNCWNKKKTPPCNEYWSNNFMDYNAHASAWSPCQIGTIHHNFHRRSSIRDMLEKTWCTFNPEAITEVNESINWLGSKDLEGNIFIGPTGKLRVTCKVSLPAGAKIKIWPGGELILDGGTLYNDCGQEWEGIEIMKKGGQEGKVVVGPNSEINNVKREITIVDSEQSRS